MKVFILLSLVAGALAFLDCPANQHYESCGSACPITCDNHNDPPTVCVLMCNPGCHCDQGYVKTASGECVKPEACKNDKQVCAGVNQRYNECGTACPLTCDNYNNQPIACTKQCVVGCECQEGYVKNAEGQCVLPKDCPAVSESATLCELEAQPGRCKGYFPRYYFNKGSGKCEQFIYGGCGGNENNFESLAECHDTCAASATDVCGENEEYATCGTACPLTCDNLANPPFACTKQCVIGCQCQKGYVKNAQGKCVLPEQCPSKAVCGANQEFQECGTACPMTCDNLNNPPKGCTLQCVVGCACSKGFVKNADGECVKPEQCEAKNLCELKAETGMCRGYFPRYHFNKASGQCEKFIYGGCGGNGNNFKSLEACQKSCAANEVCGENEEFASCGTACPLTCDNMNDPPKGCTDNCVVGCKCQKGYVKNAQGKCVLPEQCPSSAVCGVNQEFQECGTACPLTCDNLNNPPKFCTKQCVIGCACSKGFVKNAEGECVLPEECPSRAVCGANEEFNECGTACPLTCDNYLNPPKFCTLQCVIGCACSKGFVRNAEGQCVLPQQCQAVRRLDRPDCDKAPETGLCKARQTRFYYDQEAGMCKTFIYGGCGGNRNNFETRDECYNKCGALLAPKNALCAQEKVVGPCRAAFPRHFYNAKTGQCEPFIYGGCGGNGNNFGSKGDCEATCVA